MLSIKEFCKKNNMCRMTCYTLTKKGMPVIRINRKVWIDEAEAINWMKKQSENQANV